MDPTGTLKLCADSMGYDGPSYSLAKPLWHSCELRYHLDDVHVAVTESSPQCTVMSAEY
ncbi:hypothetical protein GBAR_LOCUS2101 [Geodia barretti]|uniref:Uncharacterized protein n=1 Tax=Geodia barretti TaxID=519541 RepID=A0AA35QYP2_GEOBA|nr:hypothetical protein GBAR_LOCUS2101 [Geodia barretti]